MTEKSEPRITMAALVAMLEGDIENAIIASTPGGIEAQEARGQQDFVTSETLPCKPASYHESEESMRQKLESLGIEFVEQVDDLFWYVHLPKGWTKKPTDHSMWSHLLDEKERKRASIFYKAAFYDRSAHISLDRRYSYRVEPVVGYDDPEYRKSEWQSVVTDCDKIIWTSEEKLRVEPPYEPRDEWLKWHDDKRALEQMGREYIDAHFPEWENPMAYWD